MYFSGTKPSDILLCIRRNDIRTYGKYLEDTNESIDLMEDLESLLKSSNNISTSMIFEWLKSNLKMRSSEQGNSIYKAFLCLQNDEIFNLRISNHYSNTNDTRTSWNYNGSPDSEIHIIIEEIRNPILVIRGNSILSQDTLLFDKPVLVNSYTLEDLRNPEKNTSIHFRYYKSSQLWYSKFRKNYGTQKRWSKSTNKKYQRIFQ